MYQQAWETPTLMVTRFSGEVLPEDVIKAHKEIMRTKPQTPFAWLCDARDSSLEKLNLSVYVEQFVAETDIYRAERVF